MKPLCHSCRHIEAGTSRGVVVLYCGRMLPGAPERRACEDYCRDAGLSDE